MGGRDVRGAAKRRVRRKAERPGELLDAAFAEFSQKGYAGATLDGIAARAGVTKGTIYLYFDGILAPALEALRRALRRGIARGEIRDAGIAEHPQLVFAPVVLLDLWML